MSAQCLGVFASEPQAAHGAGQGAWDWRRGSKWAEGSVVLGGSTNARAVVNLESATYALH